MCFLFAYEISPAQTATISILPTITVANLSSTQKKEQNEAVFHIKARTKYDSFAINLNVFTSYFFFDGSSTMRVVAPSTAKSSACIIFKGIENVYFLFANYAYLLFTAIAVWIKLRVCVKQKAQFMLIIPQNKTTKLREKR